MYAYRFTEVALLNGDAFINNIIIPNIYLITCVILNQRVTELADQLQEVDEKARE